MRRRVFSILLSLLSILLIIPVFPATAATDYSAELRSKGFPESYIADLNKLKQAHPKWNFEVLTVGENFSDSVSKERKSHSQQLIQNYSGNNGKGYYCTCSKCSKSGSPIVMELPNWVSASEKCVEYYLDPRNFLDEKQIFQFESILYNANQTQTGVESILNGTWMHNANITYKDKKGNSVTYSPKTKYSKAIMDAAKNSGLSAYYLASKIVQEVGGAKATAGGASGTNKSYPGIYNYYNIGANTGAVDGLKWASQSPSGAHVQTSSGASVNLRKSPVNGSIITALPSGTKVSTYEYTSKQSDGYKWVKLTNVSIGGKKYTGYIRSDYFIKGGSDSFNRPWTNPYLTIYNGAKWIATNFEDQYTGYLQKFNVNPKSSSMHSHEYMANIQAASTESVKTYNAYKNNGALNSEITFSIPVFKNMPNEKPALTAPKLNTIKVNNDCSLSLSWNSIKNADQYEIYHKNGSTYSYYKTVKTNSATLKNAQYQKTYTYAIKAINSKGTASPSAYSNAVSVTNNLRLVAPKPTAKLNSNKTVTIEWNKISAANTYKVYSKDSVKNKWGVLKQIPGTSYTTEKAAVPGVTYSYKVVADNTTSKTSIASPESSVVSVIDRIELAAPKLQPIVVNHDGSFDLIWNKVEHAAEYVIYAKSGSGSYELYKTVSTNSINIPNTDYGIKYSFKIQADNEGNAYEASSYSNVVSAENNVKLKTPTLKVAVNSNGTFKFSWEKVTGADKYQIYVKNADDSYKLFKTVTGATSYT
ncbi:MAG: hypothetical protein K2K01_07030, partial [Eubacterium sp.]|nr:hypothetical protein [Eubacterium sp.]